MKHTHQIEPAFAAIQEAEVSQHQIVGAVSARGTACGACRSRQCKPLDVAANRYLRGLQVFCGQLQAVSLLVTMVRSRWVGCSVTQVRSRSPALGNR